MNLMILGKMRIMKQLAFCKMENYGRTCNERSRSNTKMADSVKNNMINLAQGITMKPFSLGEESTIDNMQDLEGSSLNFTGINASF